MHEGKHCAARGAGSCEAGLGVPLRRGGASHRGGAQLWQLAAATRPRPPPRPSHPRPAKSELTDQAVLGQPIDPQSAATESVIAALLSEAEELRRGAAEREAALLSEAEELRRGAAEREAALLSEAEELRRGAAALLRRAEEAEARALNLEQQVSRMEQNARAADVRSLSQALSGETSTASYAELAAATGGFAASNILGRGGFGPVYRGELGGQSVAIKRLDQVCQPLFTCSVWRKHLVCSTPCTHGVQVW